MRYAYNANGLRNLSLEAAIAAVAAAGYRGIELSLHPRHLLPDASAASIRDLRARLADHDLEVPCLATGSDLLLSDERFEPSLISGSPSGRRRRLRFLADSMRLARALDAPTMSFASGILQPGIDALQARAWLLEGIEEMLETAPEDLTLVIEPEPDFLIESNDQALELIGLFDDPRLRINQDIGHCKVVDEDYLGAIERALPMTRHIHVEDIVGRVHRHEIPGDGDIDFVAFFDLLERLDYRHFVSVELYNHVDRHQEALARSLAHLQGAHAASQAVPAGRP